MPVGDVLGHAVEQHLRGALVGGGGAYALEDGRAGGFQRRAVARVQLQQAGPALGVEDAGLHVRRGIEREVHHAVYGQRRADLDDQAVVAFRRRVAARAPVLELTDEDWHEGMEVYFLSAVRPTRLVTPIMQAQKAGVIVNISTFAAFEPDPVFPTSGVFRAGLAAFTKLFADRYAADNVRMNNVLPGFIDSLPEKSEFRARVPMERYGTSEEIAATIAFLASDGAGYITGQNIRVDGGITRSV